MSLSQDQRCPHKGLRPHAGVSYGVHVQGVHAQVEGRQVHGLEHLLEGLAAATLHVHNLLGVLLHGPLDEPQQVLLVHAGGRVDVRVHLEKKRT